VAAIFLNANVPNRMHLSLKAFTLVGKLFNARLGACPDKRLIERAKPAFGLVDI
jgi:hypothetical protein